MNYEAHYNKLIERAKDRLLEGYTERHHVVPKCMGGDDSEENLVHLTPEEHYVAHQLLVKMYPDSHKLLYAARAMTMLDIHEKRTKNKEYGWLKRRKREIDSARMKGNQLTLGVEPWNKGKKWDKETRKKMSQAKLGVKRPDIAKMKQKAVIIDGVTYASCRNAAKELGIHYNTVTQWIKTGKAATA